MSSNKRFDRPVRIALGGPVGLGKTMLALRRATHQLRQALTRFFPAQDHQSRIFGFNH